MRWRRTLDPVCCARAVSGQKIDGVDTLPRFVHARRLSRGSPLPLHPPFRGDAALDGRARLGDHSARRGFMNRIEPGFASVPRVAYSACPHDCPSTCALEVEVLDERTIGRVRGAEDNDYTLGVICAKVARYAERVHHPDRLLRPLRRTGPKGSGDFAEISWDDALDLVAENFAEAERRHGAEAVWPYYYAGTMGLVMRDGINRLRHVKKYSGFYSTICNTPARVGFLAGTGRLAGPDPREMAKSDLVVIWGTNAVNTQVNVMTHATRARKERGAKIVAVDVYRNGTMQQADLAVLIRPGTDAALACAVMHCLFRDGKADRDYLARYTDVPAELEAHVRSRSPQWAAAITGCDVATIEAFAALIGERKRAYFRLGYGFSRSRNGAVNMHAASCIPAVTGAWLHEGGGHQYIQLGPKLVEPPGECRSNHEVVCALARRLDAHHPGFEMSARELIDWTLRRSGWGGIEELEAKRWIDCQPDFATAHYVDGFAWSDGKFRFKPDWPNVPHRHPWEAGPVEQMPRLPDHWQIIEEADANHPFRLATSPARQFLNSTFTETPTSRARERRPEVMIHPDDAAPLGIADGGKVVLGNERGEVRLHARLFDGVRRGVLIAESIFPNAAFEDGRGINTLTGADAIAPFGGAAFHDNKVWVKRAGL